LKIENDFLTTEARGTQSLHKVLLFKLEDTKASAVNHTLFSLNILAKIMSGQVTQLLSKNMAESLSG